MNTHESSHYAQDFRRGGLGEAPDEEEMEEEVYSRGSGDFQPRLLARHYSNEGSAVDKEMEGLRRLSAFSPSGLGPNGTTIGTNSQQSQVVASQETIQSDYNQGMTFSGQKGPAFGKELLNIAVEIGDGKSANILIRENDDPRAVSREFAQLHGISDQLREILEE